MRNRSTTQGWSGAGFIGGAVTDFIPVFFLVIEAFDLADWMGNPVDRAEGIELLAGDDGISWLLVSLLLLLITVSKAIGI